MFVGHLYVFLGEMSIWVSHLLIFFLAVCTLLYSLEINPLSVASLANILSHSEGVFSFFKIHLLILIGGLSLYNIVIVSAINQNVVFSSHLCFVLLLLCKIF